MPVPTTAIFLRRMKVPCIVCPCLYRPARVGAGLRSCGWFTLERVGWITLGFLRSDPNRRGGCMSSMEVASVGFWPARPMVRAGSPQGGAAMRDDDRPGFGSTPIGPIPIDPSVSEPNPAAWIAAVASRQDRAAFAALFEFFAPRIKTMLMRRERPRTQPKKSRRKPWSRSGGSPHIRSARAAASAWVNDRAQSPHRSLAQRETREKLCGIRSGRSRGARTARWNARHKGTTGTRSCRAR